MQMKKLAGALAAVGLALGLAGCGGGGDDGPAPGTAFVQSYGNALAATGSSSGINATALKDSFDAKYLDAGVTKDVVVASLDQDATAMAASADYSGFPATQLSGVTIDNCGADGVCTLSGELVNTDADATSVPFSVQVINAGGTYRLYGDQKTS
jgi:hypothetical protein